MADRFCKQYTASVKNSTLPAVASASSALNDVYTKDPKLATILTAPSLTSEDKSAIIGELHKHIGSGGDKGDTVKNFLATLADYNRLSLLQSICAKFGELMAASKGEVELTVTSASVSWDNVESWMSSISTDGLAVIGQQDPPETGDCCLQVPIRRPGKEA